MPRRHLHAPPRAPWWNEDCDRAYHDLRSSSGHLRQTLRARFRAAVRSAKRNFAADILHKATPEKVWDLVRWGTGNRRKRMPAIRSPDGSWAARPDEQGDVFANHFFPSQPPQHAQVSLPSDPPPREPRSFTPITISEARSALKETSNVSAPGVSGTTYRLLKWAFKSHSQVFVNLFNACLVRSYHPKVLKIATIAVVPKPRKTDTSSPRTYRPIALLECLSKWLEKIIARRLVFEIGKYELISPNQFGGRDKTSAVDACTTLAHDVRQALARRQFASILSFDIKGYFDHVQHDRLLHSLNILGFSQEIVGWLGSFLSDRVVRIKIDGHTCPEKPIAGVGIPQGSPLSPVLSTIYSFPVQSCINDIPNANLRSYIDDGLIFATGPNLHATANTLSEAIATVIKVLALLGLDIDAEKSELLHFVGQCRKVQHPFHKDKFYSTNDLASFPHVNILPPNKDPISIPPLSSMRWLGVYFHYRLAWKTHVLKMATRARSTIAGLRILANIVRGVSVANARLLYKSVVLPVLTYGSTIWYTGHKQQHLIDILTRVQNEGLRWILGAFRTSPVSELHHIGAILPIRQHLNLLSENASIRIRCLPSTSEIQARIPSLPINITNINKSPAVHRLASLSRHDIITPSHYVTPPWDVSPTWEGRLTTFIPPRSTKDSQQRHEYITNLHSTLTSIHSDPHSIIIYTDGSRRRPEHRRHRRTGAGLVFFHKDKIIKTSNHYLGRRASNYDAEMVALVSGAYNVASAIHQIKNSPDPPTITRLVFCTDNQAAVQSIVDLSDHYCQYASLSFRKHIDHLLSSFPSITSIQIRWVPGHAGIRGNEKADEQAKVGTEASDIPMINTTPTWARERARHKAIKSWRREWFNEPHQNKAGVALANIKPSTSLNQFHRGFKGPRNIHTRIIQTILGHGFYGEFYNRFNLEPDLIPCPCGEAPVQTRVHILDECPLFEPGRHHLRNASQSISLGIILGTNKGLKALAKFLSQTSAFTKPPTPNNAPQRRPGVQPHLYQPLQPPDTPFDVP